MARTMTRQYNEMMKDDKWVGLDRHPSQSPYWHNLSILAANDFRRTLTWNKRFETLDNAVNCFSVSDEVIRNIEKGAWWGDDNGSVWTLQEKFKGAAFLPLANVLNNTSITREGGWGFNPSHMLDNAAISMDTVAIKNLSEYCILTNPVFRPFVGEAAKLHTTNVIEVVKDDESQYRLRAKVLADGIPALSYSAGANAMKCGISNIDYMHDCERDDWPRNNKAWHHSDLKNVAYYFVNKLYDKIVNNE